VKVLDTFRTNFAVGKNITGFCRKIATSCPSVNFLTNDAAAGLGPPCTELNAPAALFTKARQLLCGRVGRQSARRVVRCSS